MRSAHDARVHSPRHAQVYLAIRKPRMMSIRTRLAITLGASFALFAFTGAAPAFADPGMDPDPVPAPGNSAAPPDAGSGTCIFGCCSDPMYPYRCASTPEDSSTAGEMVEGFLEGVGDHVAPAPPVVVVPAPPAVVPHPDFCISPGVVGSYCVLP